jgi:hypothetical protein
MRSLFILSLPRSMSSMVYQLAQAALPLAGPAWVSDGEVLNVERYAHFGNAETERSARFTLREHDAERLTQLHKFLDDVTKPEGFVYKDVLQPFVLSEWHGLARFNVLRIERALADVAYTMLRRRWMFARFAARDAKWMQPLSFWQLELCRVTKYSAHLHPRLTQRALEDAVLEGLLRAERVLASIPAQVLDYEHLVRDENSIAKALRELYPNEKISAPHYHDAEFIAERERILKRRATRRYRALQKRIQEIRATM